MILDLFIYIIQFYINQNTFLPGFIIRKRAELDDVASNSALFIGNWICKLLFGQAIQQK